MTSRDRRRSARLEGEYASSLRRFAAGAGELALAEAYEAGRQALSSRTALPELVQIHHRALSDLQTTGVSLAPALAGQFLAEALSPYELSLRAHYEHARWLGLGSERAQTTDTERAHRLLHTILDATSALIYLRDERQTFLFVNSRFVEVFGLQEASVLGETGSGQLGEAVLSVLDADDRAALSGHGSMEFEETFQLSGGEQTYLALKVPLIDERGKPYAVCSVSTNISERKRAAEALRAAKEETERANGELRATQAQLIQAAKMASLGELVAGIAHEINNPLAFVTAHLGTVDRSLERVQELAGDAMPGPASTPWLRARDRLKEMGFGLERIRDLVLKLRTFSRLDEGERQVADLTECLDSVLTILQHRIGAKVTLTTSLEPPHTLECFPRLLNQALMNLIANAADAVGTDGGAIQVSGRVVDGAYELEVADTGPGIPTAIRERVFEPFFTTKPVGMGTGLGLSITYSIIQRHGGSLRIECPEIGGTKIIATLPIDSGGAGR